MKTNLGKLDRIFRFVLGIWIIQWVLPSVTNTILWWVLVVLALIALLESFIGYCWIHQVCGINTKAQ